MGWLTYRLSGSVFLLGVVAFCANLGIVLFGTFAGVVADHVWRRPAIRITQSLALLQALVLAALTWTGYIEIWHLIALALFLGFVQALDIPLRQSLWVHLVEDRADLPNAIALNSFLVNTARVVGPALAGVLLGLVSEAVCFALNALSFVAVIVAIGRMHWANEPPPAAWQGGFWKSWVEGYHFVSGFAPARALLLLVGVLAWTVSPYSSLMPAYAKDVLGGGPQTLGLLLSAAGAGALVSTLYLARRPTVRGLFRVIAIAGLTCGIALAAFAYLPYTPLAALLMVFVGGGVILAAASVSTILQTIVADRLRGRVAGFYSLAFIGMAPLGSIAAGALANRLGIQATFAANGLAAAAAALIFWRALPALRHHMRPTYVKLGIISSDT